MVKHISFVSKDNIKVNLEIETRPLSPNMEVRDWETLEIVKEPVELSIRGECGGHAGQMYDAFEPTEAQARLVEFWKQYHLNSMCAGTRNQMEALKGCLTHDYKDQCEYLKNLGLYEDRGYKYGTGWLYRSFPQDELESIIADIEREEEERTADFEYPDFADDGEALEYISERTDLNPEHVFVIMKNLGLSVDEIGDIEETGNNLYEVYGTEYCVGTEYELQEIARGYIDRSMWVDAVVGGYTDDSFEDWVDSLVENDLGGILNGWDGTIDEECACGSYYTICRAS